MASVAAAGSIRTALLLAVGIVLLAVGILFGDGREGIAIAQITIGAGLVTVGVLLPQISELEIGPRGLKAKLRERDIEITPIIEHRGERLARLAALLAASPAHATLTAREALARTYVELPRTDDPAAEATRQVVKEARRRVPESPPDETGGGGDSWRALASELASLPADDRAAIVLHISEGMDEARIADLLGMPPGAVREALLAAGHQLARPEAGGAT